MLDEAIAAAGLARDRLYLTNAVKHVRHADRGKRRIHQKPTVRHLEACAPWLDAELALVAPSVVVCLGATAARAVLGRTVTIGEVRGHVLHERSGHATVVTTHPSALLRLRGRGGDDDALAELADDLSSRGGCRAPAGRLISRPSGRCR